MHDQTFDEQKADKGLSQADTVAKKRALVLMGDLEKGVIRLLLILVQNGIHLRPTLLPGFRWKFVTLEQFLESLGVNLKGSVFSDLPLNDADHAGSYVLSFLPMLLVPRLKLRHVARSTNLDVEFDVLG